MSHGFTSKFSAVLETRQIEIDTTHGNLPKLGLSYLWTPRVLTTVAYAQSVGGNLGTELTSVRIDYYGNVTLTAGGAWGQADPSVVNVTPGLSLPAQDTRQGFVGIGKTFSRGEILLLGDYLELERERKGHRDTESSRRTSERVAKANETVDSQARLAVVAHRPGAVGRRPCGRKAHHFERAATRRRSCAAPQRSSCRATAARSKHSSRPWQNARPRPRDGPISISCSRACN